MSQKPSDTPKVCWMQHSRARNYVAEATALGARVSLARLFFIYGTTSVLIIREIYESVK